MDIKPLKWKYRLIRRLLTPIYKGLYHQFAWTYHSAAWVVSLGQWNDTIRHFATLIPTGPVLELGHGPGILQEELERLNITRFGIDESRQMNRMAWRRAKRANQSADLVNCLAQILPLPDHAFRTVVATFPADYIFDQDTLGEVQRVLLPRGDLLILLSAYFWWNHLGNLFRREKTGSHELPDGWVESIRGRFAAMPWKVEVLAPAFRKTTLLIIHCQKL